MNEESHQFKVCGSGNTGRGGTQIIYEGRKYKSWAEASRQTGLTKCALRWRIKTNNGAAHGRHPAAPRKRSQPCGGSTNLRRY